METANFNLNLSDGWLFHHGELGLNSETTVTASHLMSKTGGALKELNMFGEDVEWKKISIPHDWASELPFDKNALPAEGFKHRGTAWYYISFELPDKKIDNAKIIFNGVLGKCEVFVNGVVATRNFSGYNRFSAEIGDYLLPAQENSIALHVDARRCEGWWYEGAGIYRSVYIEFRENTRFDKEKFFVRGNKTNDVWEILADTCVINPTENTLINTTLKDSNGNTIYNGAAKQFMQIPVENPKLWSPENPYLYSITFELTENGRVIDTLTLNTALRDIEWKANEGMFLNGSHYPVKGICCHQDHAGVGAATTKEITEYRILQLKKLGANAYRCAHHAPDETLLEICDRLGMLVMAENRHFSVSEDVLCQLDALVVMSRNHPCVFLYSLFNEEPWQTEERGCRIAAKMRERVLLLDNTRAIMGAQNFGLLEKTNASDSLDIIGINYRLKDFEEAHKRQPDKVILGTENCPVYATRGIYTSNTDRQMFASYGDEWPSFSESLTETMDIIYSSPYIAGCFVWMGFESRGEPTPFEWPSTLSHWGLYDYCGFPKDTAYHLAAFYKNELFVHLLPHWSWNQASGISNWNDICGVVSSYVRVCAFTNADSAELFVNGKSAGVNKVCEGRAEWRVKFEKGEIKVVASRGTESATDEIKTAEEPYGITLTDVTPSNGTSEIHIINASVTDKNQTVIPSFCENVKFNTHGLEISGVGNGNPNSLHNEKANEINFFNGYAQIIVKGSGTLTADCDGLPEAEINL